MQRQQTVAVKFLDGNWRIQPILVNVDARGTLITPLHLDRIFTLTDSSFRFMGYSRKTGRPMYEETTKERKFPRQHIQPSKEIDQ